LLVRAAGTIGVLLVASMCAAASAQAAALPPPSYYGVNIQPLYEPAPLFVPQSDFGGLYGTLATDGVQTVRMDAIWAWAEPKAPVNGLHTYVWNPSGVQSMDQMISTLASHGLRMIAVIDTPPAWAKGSGTSLEPAHYGDFEAFAAAFAARYGAGGTFWQQNPTVPYLPIEQFEVWDEANSAAFWTGSPNASTYMQVLVPLSAAVHAVDPSAEVLASIGWQNLQGYVSQLYSLGVKGSIQGIALHPYAPDAPSIVGLTEELRSTLVSSGDPNLPIYADEAGLPETASGPGAAYAYDGPVSDAARAATLSLSGDALAHGDCGVQGYDVFSLVGDDDNRVPGGGGYFGIFNYQNDTPNITGAAIVAASQRWQNNPEGGLVLCGTGTTQTAALLPLGVQLTHTSPTCLSAVITYQGNPLEAAQLVLTTADGRVAPAGTNAFGQTQMCLQNGPAITSFNAYAEVSSPITTASLTAPNMARSATYTCPITTAPCVIDSPASSAGGDAGSASGAGSTGSTTAHGYRLDAKIVRIRGKILTLRARLVGTSAAPPPAKIRVWLQIPKKKRLRLLTTTSLSAGEWHTFTAHASVRVGDHILVGVVADKSAGLTALQTALRATRRVGAR
jgi:hypothetical protein